MKKKLEKTSTAIERTLGVINKISNFTPKDPLTEAIFGITEIIYKQIRRHPDIGQLISDKAFAVMGKPGIPPLKPGKYISRKTLTNCVDLVNINYI